jgi:hypothetical protein
MRHTLALPACVMHAQCGSSREVPMVPEQVFRVWSARAERERLLELRRQLILWRAQRAVLLAR